MQITFKVLQYKCFKTHKVVVAKVFIKRKNPIIGIANPTKSEVVIKNFF